MQKAENEVWIKLSDAASVSSMEEVKTDAESVRNLTNSNNKSNSLKMFHSN